jgi:cytoskeletal protein CcmA (bactofilin family)
MWKKEDGPETTAAPRPAMTPGVERPAAPRTAGGAASIGRSITIRGEVTGDEDLLIQGHVEGSVNLKQHAVTVGAEGEVKADITARIITVEGRVEGNLKAEEQVILRSAAIVEGDIAAPRVVLEDGARFRGGVDMGETLERGRTADRPNQASTPAAARPAAGTGDSGTKNASGASDGDASASTRPQGAAPHTTAHVSR